jgi:hypothetical protein
MLIKGKDLQLKFNALFDFQKEQEDKINPQNKKALKK